MLIPVYNESGTIDELLRQVLSSSHVAQVVVADDGSQDDTPVLLDRWQAHPMVDVLRHPVNRGKGAAIRTALAHARGELVIVQDADLEYDPRDYGRLLEPIERGEADVVYGSRVLGGGPPPWRRGLFGIGIVALNWLVRLLYGVKITDEATCYKVFRTADLRAMDLQCERFEFCPEVTAKACGMGLRIVEVPIHYSPRSAAEGKKIRWRDGVVAAYTLWRWRRWRPPANWRAARIDARSAAERKSASAHTVAEGAGRRGLTLVELLVTLSIIGVLMAVLLPAVMQSRETARRSQCASNLRNIGLAMRSEANAKGRLPAAGYFATTGTNYHSWVVSLLPWLERNDLSRAWNYDRPLTANMALANNQINVLTCPDDDTVVRGEGNLSYVVNGGFGWTEPVDCPSVLHLPGGGFQISKFDYNGNGVVCPTKAAKDESSFGGDKDLFFKTSLFFAENWPVGSGTVRHHTLDTITDGLSRTIVLAENLWAGYDPATGANWANPQTWRACFFISGYVCASSDCSSGKVRWGRANDRSRQPYKEEAINGRSSRVEGASPWPSSGHPGGVSVIYCDAHVSFLSDDVDGAVYASLVTPQGATIRGPLAQPPLNDLAP